MLNRCEFIGNLGRDPEIRTTQSGKKCANLRLAVTEKYKDRDGNRQEKTEWISLVIWADGLVRTAEQYLRKGSKIYASGSLITRKWQNQAGEDRYSTEVVMQGFDAKLIMLDTRQTDRSDEYNQDHRSPASPGGQAPSGGSVDDDEIPF